MVTEGAFVDGEVDFSMIFEGVTIEKGAVVRDSILMPGAYISSGAIIEYAIIGENSEVGINAKIGERPENTIEKEKWGVAVVGHNIKISPNTKVLPKQIISKNI